MLDATLAATIQLWAHVVLLLGALALAAFVAERGYRREDRLRKRLGSSRSALASAEILRDRYRRERDALSIEVGRYRRLCPPEFRLTQVQTVGGNEPEPGA